VTGPQSVWPFAELLGMRAKFIGDGRARFELAVEPKHLNPHGTLHGGVVYSLADSAMGAALFSLLGEGEHYLEAKVYGDGDRLVALATGTFYIQSART